MTTMVKTIRTDSDTLQRLKDMAAGQPLNRFLRDISTGRKNLPPPVDSLETLTRYIHRAMSFIDEMNDHLTCLDYGLNYEREQLAYEIARHRAQYEGDAVFRASVDRPFDENGPLVREIESDPDWSFPSFRGWLMGKIECLEGNGR